MTRGSTEAATVGPRRCLDLIRGITSASREERHKWANVAGEWYIDGELDDREVAAVAAVLGWAALLETEVFDIRADFLNSLGIMADNDRVPMHVLLEVTSGLLPEDLDVAEEDHYEILIDKLKEYRRLGGNPVFDRLPGAQQP